MSIHQEIQINVSVSQVFGALTRSAVFSQISGGAPAEIDARNGGAFSCFGGMITGRNIELDENRLIVQAWRAGNWPPGTYSLVNFAFSETDGGSTRIEFTQYGHPQEVEGHLIEGWSKMYWEPMKKFFVA